MAIDCAGAAGADDGGYVSGATSEMMHEYVAAFYPAWATSKAGVFQIDYQWAAGHNERLPAKLPN